MRATSLVVLCSALLARSTRAHPADPFSGEYAVPEERDVGTAAGQLHLVASPMLGLASQGTSLGGELTAEIMTVAVIGIRTSIQVDLVHSSADPSVLALRTGPALHVLPYHAVDLALFVEGGIARVEASAGGAYYVPVLSPGIDFDVWLTPSWFVRLEGHLDWLTAAGDTRSYLRATGTVGLGLGF